MPHACLSRLSALGVEIGREVERRGRGIVEREGEREERVGESAWEECLLPGGEGRVGKVREGMLSCLCLRSPTNHLSRKSMAK